MLVGEVFARMGLDSKQYEKGLDRLEGITQKKAMTLGSIFRGAFSFAIGIGVMQSFRSLGGAITDFVNTAARTEVLDVAMMAVAKATGTSTREIRAQEEALRDLGIAKQEAKQMLTRFMQAELDVADATKLARVAQDAAVIAGYNSSQAAEQMTEAIAKQRPELLSAFGFTRNLNEIYNDYAKTVNKTAKQLSEAEKKQAMLNYILAEGEKIAGTYEASMGAVGKIIGSLKRYWDDLKDAIAKPLALPAISVFVEALTNGLKNAIRWAEENKVRLQIWGQTVANVFRTIIGWVSRFVGLSIKYWTTIIKPTLKFQWVILRMAGYFIILIKAISLAKIITGKFAYVMGILRGQTYVTGGAFGFLSAAVQYYRYQLKLANMAGITSLGVMAKTIIGIKSIGVAIKGLLASIPVVGWIVLALGLLAEAAIYVSYNWEKVKHYGLQAWSALKQGIAYYVYGILSLYRLLFGWIPGVGKAYDVLRKKALEVAKAETAIRKARAQAFAQKPLDPYAEYEKKMEEYYKQLEEYEASLGSSFAGAKDGADKTTDSIEKMNKVAGDGIQSFDEVHQLMEQAGDAAGELDDALGLDLGLEEMPEMPEMPKMPTLEETGFIERISGMWDDIASSISTGATEAWTEFGDTMKESWEAFKGDWEKIFKAFTWENIKQKFVDGWDKVKTKWQEVREEFTWENIKQKFDDGWTGFQSWFSQTWAGQIWDKVKIKWQEVREEFTWENIKQKFVDGWTGFQSWFSQTWAGKIWDKVKIKWQEVREEFTWANIKQKFINGWTGFQSWFSQTWAGQIWDGVKQKWDNLKTNAPETWENIKKSISERWEELRTSAPTTWEEIRKNISDRWEALKTGAPTVWENIKTSIQDRWDSLASGASEKWGNIKTTINDRWEELKTNAPTVWENIKNEISQRWEELKVNAPITWENIKKEITDRWENLKTNAPTTWENIKTSIQDRWENLKTNAPTVWENIKKEISDRWEALKTDAPTAWENIRKSISDKWEELKTNAPITWEEIRKNISDRWEALKTDAPTAWENIRKSINDKWEELKTNAPITWEEIKKGISERWEALKTDAPITWEDIKKEITDRWDALKTDAPTAWEDIAGSIERIWEGIKKTAGDIWDSMTNDVIKGAINGIINLINRLIDMWNSLKFEVPSITIGNKTFGGYTVSVPQIEPLTPLAKGGLVTAPTLAMLGEAGPEAVIPLGRSGFAEDLADTVARAVYQAIMDAARISQASAGGDDREIVLKIDNTTLARMQLPAIIREGQRQGLDLVVQPQGV